MELAAYIYHMYFLQDLLYANRTFDNCEEIRNIYLLHALNHVLKLVAAIVWCKPCY